MHHVTSHVALARYTRTLEPNRSQLMSDATVANQKQIIANQKKILANQKRIEVNQAKLDKVLANQRRILAKLS